MEPTFPDANLCFEEQKQPRSLNQTSSWEAFQLLPGSPGKLAHGTVFSGTRLLWLRQPETMEKSHVPVWLPTPAELPDGNH